MTGHARWVNGAAFDSSGTWLATASSDETMRLWDATSGALLSTLHGHTASVTAVVVVPGRPRIVSAAADGTLRWWDTALADASRVTWRHADGDVYGLDVSPDGTSV